MIKLASEAEKLAIEKEIMRQDGSVRQIREAAAVELSAVIEREFGYVAESGAIGLIGPGAKGDVVVHTLILLARENWSVAACLIGNRDAENSDLLVLKELGCEMITCGKGKIETQLKNALKKRAVWIDAILEENAPLPPDEDAAAVMKAVNAVSESSPSFHNIVAIDCPSGICAGEGKPYAHALLADLTVALGTVNPAIMNARYYQQLGDLRTVDFPLLTKSSTFQELRSSIMEYDTARDILEKARKTAPEMEYQSSLCVLGGSVPRPGGVILAARAALRTGTDSVTLAVPSLIYEALAGHIPEAGWLLLPHETGVLSADGASLFTKSLHEYGCVYLGPGIGEELATKDLFSRILDNRAPGGKRAIGFVKTVQDESPSARAFPPFVIDQDALVLLGQIPAWHRSLPACVLVLEQKAFNTLVEKEPSATATNPVDRVRKLAAELNQVVLLKDHALIVAEPGGRVSTIPGPAHVCRTGTAYLLGGLTAGLCARGVDLFDAACCSAWVYQAAVRTLRNQAREAAGIIASDIESALPDVLGML